MHGFLSIALYKRFIGISLASLIALWPFVGLLRAILVGPGVTVLIMVGAELLISRATAPDWANSNWLAKAVGFVGFVLLGTPLVILGSLSNISVSTIPTWFWMCNKIFVLYLMTPAIAEISLLSIRAMRPARK